MSKLTSAMIGQSVVELFKSQGLEARCEFTLSNGRRIDVLGVGKSGRMFGAEIKIDERDYRRDDKWPEYLSGLTLFFFAVPVGFNWRILHPGAGIILSYGSKAVLFKRNRWRIRDHADGLYYDGPLT